MFVFLSLSPFRSYFPFSSPIHISSYRNDHDIQNVLRPISVSHLARFHLVFRLSKQGNTNETTIKSRARKIIVIIIGIDES